MPIQEKAPLAIACSGGPDSMALALLARDWAVAKGHNLIALTVDHGLRRESAAEAKQVGAWLKKRDIAHVVLNWKGRKPTANLQEEARKARYQLMAEFCAKHGIAHLLVAHTLDDQAETFLLRLARGSGVDGLAAIAPQVTLYGLQVLRPLLEVPKARLLAYLKTRRQPFISDPGNENPAFDRVRMRKAMPDLAKLGLTAQRLAATAANMARARAHLEEETGSYLARSCTIHPEGYAVWKLAKASQEITLRALNTLVMMMGGNELRTRLGDLERLHAALSQPGFKGATLGGCIFTRRKDGILVLREPGAAAKPVLIKPGESTRWDNRFDVTLEGDAPRLMLGALGQAGWLFCARTHALSNALPDKRILYSLPALRDKEGWLYAVPQLGLCVEGAKCHAVFRMPN